MRALQIAVADSVCRSTKKDVERGNTSSLWRMGYLLIPVLLITAGTGDSTAAIHPSACAPFQRRSINQQNRPGRCVSIPTEAHSAWDLRRTQSPPLPGGDRKIVRNGLEQAVQRTADGVDNRQDCDADSSGNQTVFDRRNTGLVVDETVNKLHHGLAPAIEVFTDLMFTP
jgi:hypothetical protein